MQNIQWGIILEDCRIKTRTNKIFYLMGYIMKGFVYLGNYVKNITSLNTYGAKKFWDPQIASAGETHLHIDYLHNLVTNISNISKKITGVSKPWELWLLKQFRDSFVANIDIWDWNHIMWRNRLPVRKSMSHIWRGKKSFFRRKIFF